jgi:aspartokinase/homoserine dehydrogenase 1
MTARLSVVQLGRGTIGAALIEQIREQGPALSKRLGVEIVYAGVAGRRTGAFDPHGLDLARWRDEVESGGLGGRKILKKALGVLSGSAVLVDATAEEGMAELYLEALSAGFHVVSCNKKPLAGPLGEYLRV